MGVLYTRARGCVSKQVGGAAILTMGELGQNENSWGGGYVCVRRPASGTDDRLLNKCQCLHSMLASVEVVYLCWPSCGTQNQALTPSPKVNAERRSRTRITSRSKRLAASLSRRPRPFATLTGLISEAVPNRRRAPGPAWIRRPGSNRRSPNCSTDSASAQSWTCLAEMRT